MDIKELQISKAKKEAILLSLRKGRVPLVSDVNNYIRNKFKSSPSGFPVFRPILGKKYAVSDKKSYNLMMNNIHSDLQDLFDADTYINNEILSTFNFYESKKNRLLGQLNTLQNEIDGVIDIIDNPKIKNTISDSFDDFTKVEFTGDGDRNINMTTSYIDLLTKEASNDTSLVNKVDLGKATAKLKMINSSTSNEELSAIANCLNDNMNETWIQKIKNDTGNSIELEVVITLAEPSKVNTIQFDLNSPRKCDITLCTMDEEGNIKNHNTITTAQRASWNFKSINISSVTFNIIKQESDGAEGIEYEYFVGAKSISMFENVHYEKSILMSQPFSITKPFSQVYLNADDSIPPSTNINYFIGIDKAEHGIGWMQVRNGGITELNLLPKNHQYIDKSYKDYNKEYNGLRIVGSLPEAPTEYSTELHLGIDMWSVREIPYTTNTLISELESAEITAYNDMSSIQYEIKSNVATMYTAYAEYETPTVVPAVFYNTTVNHSIYINGIKVNGSLDKNSIKYNLRMTKGWNEIKIVIINQGSNTTFKFDGYFQEFATLVKGYKECKEVDPFDLIFNSHDSQHENYCVENNKLIVNYDIGKLNTRYLVMYRYNVTPGLFEDSSVRLMCTLSTRNLDVTPRLSSYQIGLI